MRLKTAETLSGNLSQQTSFNRLYTNLSIRPFLGGGGGGGGSDDLRTKESVTYTLPSSKRAFAINVEAFLNRSEINHGGSFYLFSPFRAQKLVTLKVDKSNRENSMIYHQRIPEVNFSIHKVMV